MLKTNFTQLRTFGLLATALWCLWGAIPEAHATHNLAGQITYKRIGTNTFEIIITTYTDPDAAGVDRCAVDLEIWGISGGVGTQIDRIRDIPRANGPPDLSGGCTVPNAGSGVNRRRNSVNGRRILYNFYRTVYTFPGPGRYELRYYDFARINDVRNMNNSGALAFYVNTVLDINNFIGPNNSPQLLNDPLDDACLNRRWSHNPGGFDPDGDSLVYSLIPNKNYNPGGGVSNPLDVPGYQYPSAFGGTFTIDRQTGLVVWDGAQQVGIYNIAIQVEEYRNGRRIGVLVRDMAIFVVPCRNRPPEITTLRDTCMKPGQQLTFVSTITDPDSTDSVYFYLNNGLQGLNGPFAVPTSPATLIPSAANQPFTRGFPVQQALFLWDVTCDHVRPSKYQVDWYGHDNLVRSPGEPTLSDNDVTTIQVVPQELDSIWLVPGSRQITVNWTPHACTNILGYNIYRSSGPGNAPRDSICCNGGRSGPPPGFTRLAFVAAGITNYLDNNNGAGLEFQDQYCYVVTAVFPAGMQSCPTQPECVQLSRDLPVMVNDSVTVTDAANGAILVRWMRPDLEAIDTVFYPLPYFYQLQRATGQSGAGLTDVPGGVFSFNDTTFIDTPLDTRTTNYTHRVRLLDATTREVQPGNSASSILLTVSPGNFRNFLQWRSTTPWTNQVYEIFRSTPNEAGPYTLLDTVFANGQSSFAYSDDSLTVGVNYCYFVRSTGQYSRREIRRPLKNDSNRGCAVPRDSIPPCVVGRDSLTLNADCDSATVDLRWVVDTSATCTGDLAFARLYYSRTQTGSRVLIHQTPNPGTQQYQYRSAQGITGCYVVTLVDTFGNESGPSQALCVQGCDIIDIPGVWTPNDPSQPGGWGPNNPRGIARMQAKVFDRWGLNVFSGNLLTNRWKGDFNGIPCPEGVYYYVLDITLDDLNFTRVQRTGHLTLLR